MGWADKHSAFPLDPGVTQDDLDRLPKWWIDARHYQSPIAAKPNKKRKKRKKGGTGPAQLPPMRQRVYERDGHRCVQCGTDSDLTLDHIKPRSRGGKTVMENLQTMCKPCNGAKADTWPQAA